MDASAWNAKAYHWEEKSISKWAEERFRELLLKVKYRDEVQKAEIAISSIRGFSGEASLNIRKGKKILDYDYPSIQCDWKYSSSSPEGSALGSIEIKEMDSNAGKEPTIVCTLLSGSFGKGCEGEKLKEKLVEGVKETVKSFVSELSSK